MTSIKLWKANLDGSLKLPTRVPCPIPYCSIWGNDVSRLMEKEKFISVGLSKYVDFWKVGIVQNLTYEMKMKPYVEYWDEILLHLSRPLSLQNAILLEDFWPSSNWRSNYAKALLSIVMDVVDVEDPIQLSYCGLKNMRPLTAYTTFKDFNVKKFVVVRPHDHDLVPF